MDPVAKFADSMAVVKKLFPNKYENLIYETFFFLIQWAKMVILIKWF